MSKLFESHRMTVWKNDIVSVNRQPVSKLVEVATEVPCRITGTAMSHLKPKLFILAKHYDKIPGGLHKNYQVTLDGEFVQDYLILKEPLWAGGARHHVEAELEEAK